ncbi:MAG TPA: Npt1/Npt2 family nucleotide transporter [Candidatus Binatia bacterium]|nr:Npt1/Npt2 family nucleotide transporter [Candidatus Binatia bacterium]
MSARTPPPPGSLTGVLNRPAVRSVLLFLDFFLIILAYYQVKPASRSLFLEHGSAAQLPYLWVGSAALLVALMPIYQRMVRHFSRLNIVLGTCAVVVAMLVLFRVLLRDAALPTAVGFYLLVDIFSVVLVEQFWSLTNSVYRSSDGRRWYGLIASGGLVGGAVGGLLAAWLVSAKIAATADLLLVSAGIIGLMMGLTWWLARYGFYDEALPLYTPEKSDATDIWTAVRNSRYLMLIALMLLLSQICEPIVEYQFMHLVELTYTDAEARTAYLSGFLSLLSGVALLVNLAVAPLLLRRFGAAAGILAQPVLLGLSALGFAFEYRLWMAGAVKLCDRALAYSINRTARELLYVWVDAATIYRAKAWIDMVGYRGFKIVGSITILLLTQWLPWKVSDAGLSWTVVVMCAGWIVAGVYLVRRLLPELIVRAQRGAAPSPAPGIAAAPAHEPAPAQPHRTVLVAEDHEQGAMMLRLMLERWGFTVILAADGAVVQERVALHAPPDLALLDIMLPHVDGFGLVSLIRASPEWRDVPIIMLTGRTGEREINRALAAGANDYMVKPFGMEELRARIARLLPGDAMPA